MKTNNKTDNFKLFGVVFLLLFIFGLVFLGTVYFFGAKQYLPLGVVAQLLILANLFLWCYSVRWQNLLKRPVLLVLIYFLKIMLFIVILAVVSHFL